jgi:peptide/nickel transport system substrate-binding protein
MAAQPSASTGQAAAGTPAAATPSSFKEAPQITQLVKDGKLPATAERLPKKPLVIKPIEKVGKYGGT